MYKETDELSLIEEIQELNKTHSNIHSSHSDSGVAHGGGEGPAEIGAADIENEYSSLPTTTNGSAFRSLTGSMSLSVSVSSCNATQKSKMSASAMSVMAATMNHHEEMINESFITGLDDFTSLFGEAEARNLLELLKLSVSGRAGPSCNVQTIANTLIALGANSVNIGNMVLETCVTELEDLCTSRLVNHYLMFYHT